MIVTLTPLFISLVPRLPFPFLFDGGKKGLVDLHRLFCSADPQILGIAKYRLVT